MCFKFEKSKAGRASLGGMESYNFNYGFLISGSDLSNYSSFWITTSGSSSSILSS